MTNMVLQAVGAAPAATVDAVVRDLLGTNNTAGGTKGHISHGIMECDVAMHGVHWHCEQSKDHPILQIPTALQ
jgi:hypothetical protein